MFNSGYMHTGFGFGHSMWFNPIASILMLIVFALKGYSLWNAAKRNEIWWFLAIFVLNTWGILELIYLIVVLKKHETIQSHMHKHDHSHDNAHHDHHDHSHHHDHNHPHTPPTN